MSDRSTALWGVSGVFIGALITGSVSIITTQKQGEVQLQALYATNAFTISKELRPKAEDFFNASRRFFYWYSTELNTKPSEALVSYLMQAQQAISAANAISPYLGYAESGYVNDFVRTISDISVSLTQHKTVDRATVTSLSCQYANIELLLNKRLANLDSVALPDLGDGPRREALKAVKVKGCE